MVRFQSNAIYGAIEKLLATSRHDVFWHLRPCISIFAWTIEADPTAPTKPNVLTQSGKATFPVALKNGSRLQDGFVEAKFKAIAGSEDRAAGLIWRAKDANNYYSS
jgi:hypothetical protein